MNDMMTIEGTKPKSIIIDGQLHNKFKVLCKGKNMKIGGVIEDLIRLYLTDSKNLQKLIDDAKKNNNDDLK